MTQAQPFENKVLIVGAGPTGLMLAHELGRFGISFRIIDAQVQKPMFSRAIGVQIRTQEIFSSLGLFKNLSKHAATLSGIEVYAEGRTPVKIPIVCNFSSFKGVMVVDQPYTEQVLEEALEAAGVKIERGTALVGLKKTPHGFLAELKNHAGDTSCEDFSYVLGADGAHSFVRKNMSTPFAGKTYDDAFILADAECLYEKNHHSFKLFFNKKAFLAIVPMAQKNQHRLISVRRNDLRKNGPEPTKAEFEGLVKSLVPFDFTIKNVTWASRFFVPCKSAQTYQEDKLFLVGDAAHIHSPAGGQGMNTGLQDAFNLAFKLALSIKGKATPKLLETYTQERRPVGEFLLKRTDALFRFMVQSSIWARLLRRILLPSVAKWPMMRRRIFRIGSQVAIRYKKGCICMQGGHLSGPNFQIGARVPSFELTDEEQKKIYLHELFRDLSFINFIFCPVVDEPNLSDAIELCSGGMTHNFGENIKNIVLFKSKEDAQKIRYRGQFFIVHDELSAIPKPMYFLVRPDHHVFCMAPLAKYPHAISSLQEYLRA